MTRFHIKIEGTDEQQMQELFEEIQNKHSLFDNCIIEEINDEESFIEKEDRCEETGGIACERPKEIDSKKEEYQDNVDDSM